MPICLAGSIWHWTGIYSVTQLSGHIYRLSNSTFHSCHKRWLKLYFFALPEEERRNQGRSDLLNTICILLGGTTAEKISFDDITTGAANDLKKATEIARRMVSQFGMSDKIGPAVFPQGEIHPFLGREIAQDRKYSEHTARLIDDEVIAIINGMRDKVEKILTENRDNLAKIAEELLKKETLDNADIDAILGTGKEEKKQVNL